MEEFCYRCWGGVKWGAGEEGGRGGGEEADSAREEGGQGGH